MTSQRTGNNETKAYPTIRICLLITLTGLRPDLYYLAYQNLYSNKGASTKGVDDDTADGFSIEKISKIIEFLADESYAPKPVRREYIQKKQNSTKKRPLGSNVIKLSNTENRA